MALEKALFNFVVLVLIFGILAAIAAGGAFSSTPEDCGGLEGEELIACQSQPGNLLNEVIQTDVLFSNPFEGISGLGVLNPGAWVGATVTYVLAWVRILGFPVGVFFGGAASTIAGLFVLIGGILIFALIRSFFGR